MPYGYNLVQRTWRRLRDDVTVRLRSSRGLLGHQPSLLFNLAPLWSTLKHLLFGMLLGLSILFIRCSSCAFIQWLPGAWSLHWCEQTILWRRGIEQQTGILCSSILNRGETIERPPQYLLLFFTRKLLGAEFEILPFAPNYPTCCARYRLLTWR